MKKLFIALLAWCAWLPMSIQASPYLRPGIYKGDDGSLHYQTIFGGLIDPKDLGNSSGVGLFATVTHSPKDGCILPSIVCEDWTPLAVGGAMNAGKVTLDFGPVFNVLPWMQSGALAILPASFSATRKMLQPQEGSQSVTFSGGPMCEYRQVSNDVYFKIFTGLALHW